MQDNFKRSKDKDAQLNTLIPAVAQAERSRIFERTNEGRLEAKAQGIKFGRKRTIDRQKLLSIRAFGLGATEIAKQSGIGRSTVYKLLSGLST